MSSDAPQPAATVSVGWGIFDFRDNTWLMNEPAKHGWTRKPSHATRYRLWDTAKTDIDQLASSVHTPAIRPRLLPHGDDPH